MYKIHCIREISNADATRFRAIEFDSDQWRSVVDSRDGGLFWIARTSFRDGLREENNAIKFARIRAGRRDNCAKYRRGMISRARACVHLREINRP